MERLKFIGVLLLVFIVACKAGDESNGLPDPDKCPLNCAAVLCPVTPTCKGKFFTLSLRQIRKNTDLI